MKGVYNIFMFTYLSFYLFYIYCYLSLLKGISGCGIHIQLEQVWNEHIVSSKYIYNIVIVS